MSRIPSQQIQTSQNTYPSQLLQQLSESRQNGLVKVATNSVEWHLYFHLGQLIFANCTLASADRLERHLRRLTHETKTLTRQTCIEVES